MSTAIPKTIAIILSGGAGQRLGGADKGLLEYNGKPLIESVIERIENQVDSAVICANRNIERYKKFGLPVIKDHQTDFQGPLAGIEAALKFIQHGSQYADATHALITTCDSPRLPHDYLCRLHDALASNEHTVAVVHDGQRKQNLHCLIARASWSSLIEFYREEGRAMHRWLRRINATDVNFADQADCFLNVNTLKQLPHS